MAERTRPFTGQEYIESLRDGREIWIYGERVKDVTTHPAFRNTVRMMARLYDALHDETQGRAVHARPTPAAAATRTSSSRRPATAEEMVGARDAIAEWARVTYGWMGRSPDYKAAFLATLGANSDFYTRRSRRTRAAGTRRCRRKSPSSITPSSIRRSIATSSSTKSATSTCTSRRRPTAG